MQRELLEDSYEGYFDFQQCKPTPWADPEAPTDSEVTTMQGLLTSCLSDEEQFTSYLYSGLKILLQ